MLQMEIFQFRLLDIFADEWTFLDEPAPCHGTAPPLIAFHAQQQVKPQRCNEHEGVRKRQPGGESKNQRNGQKVKDERQPQPLEDKPYDWKEKSRPGETLLDENRLFLGSLRRPVSGENLHLDSTLKNTFG